MEDNGQNEVGNRFKKGCFFETISLFEVQTVPFLNAELVPLFAGLWELGETTHEETRVLFIASGNLDQPFTMCSSMHSNVWISFNKSVVREIGSSSLPFLRFEVSLLLKGDDLCL
jgi:hypothetical protein